METNSPQGALAGLGELQRFMASVELWGDEHQAAGRLGAPVGQATIEDGDLSLTVQRWLAALAARSDGAEAAEVVSLVLAWMSARYALGQAEAIESHDYAAGVAYGAADARAAELRERWSPLLLRIYARPSR